MTGVRHIDIPPELEGQRIDNFLRRELKGLPKTRIYRLLRRGEVRVNGGRARPAYRLRRGDRLRLPPMRLGAGAAPGPSERVRDRLESAILYEDDRLLVLDKPSGLAVHGGSGLAYGVVEAVRAMRPDERFIDLAHRLDRDTSGCLVLAKRRSTLRRLHALLREGAVRKRYTALLAGCLPAGATPVALPLERQRGPGGETVVRVSAAGKESRTVFVTQRRFPHWTLVEVELDTGRMHQIRVHAAYLGHPVGGDPKYGDAEADSLLRALGLRRLFLHASRIGFEPPDGPAVDVSAPLPADLAQVLKALESDTRGEQGAS